MSDILKKWLHEEVGVSNPIGNFEEDFASGFKLGEIFHNCNLQPDFDRFVNKSHPDAMINNFTRLQPTMTKLGLNFDSKMANQIMTEEKGVVTKFLYQLKTLLSQVHKDLHTSKLQGNFAKTLTMPVAPTTLAVEATRSKAMKEGYDAQTHHQFEKNVRFHAQHPNQIMETMHLRPFADEQLHQEERANYEEVMDYTMTIGRRDTHRNQRLDLMRMTRREKAEMEEMQIQNHRASQAYNRALEKKEVQIELAVAEKKGRREWQRSVAAGNEAVDGISQFEKNLKRLGCDEAAGDDGLDRGELPPVGPTPIEHLQRIKTLLPAPTLMTQEGAEYMARLGQKKAEAGAARQERERRRRKVLVEQQQQQQEAEEKQREEALLRTLARQSEQEQRLAERLWQLKQEKEVMKENRQFREEQYRARREADYAEDLAREAELSMVMKAQFEEAAEKEAERWREAERVRNEQKKAKRHKMVAEVALEMVGLAVRCAEYRERTDSLVPRKEYREWVSLFVKGVPLEPSLMADTGPPPEPPEAAMVLDQSTVTDYLECCGEWETPEPIGVNQELGVIVNDLMHVTTQGPEPPELPDLYFPVKLALVGAPFCGKSTIAQKLAEEQGLKLLDPEELVQEAVEEAVKADETDKAAAAEAAEDGGLAPADGTQPPPAPSPEPAEGEGEAKAKRASGASIKSNGQDPSLAVFADGDGKSKTKEDEEDEDEDAVPEDETPKVPPIVELGRKARQALQEGLEVPDEVIVDIMILAFRKLAQPQEELEPPGSAGGTKGAKAKEEKKADPKAKDAKAPAKGAKGGAEDALIAAPAVLPEPRGFVVDGFPRTSAQAVLLETKMTGLDLDYRAALKAKASVIAPPPHDPNDDLPLVSGFDKVVVLSVSEEAVALRRALGRRVDPQTGRIYHMEFDPPPDKDAGLMERLKESMGPYNDSAQAQARLTAMAAEAPAFEDWLARFDSLTVKVDADGAPLEQVFPIVKDVAEAVLAAKQKALETSLAAKATQEAKEATEKAMEAAQQARAASQEAATTLLTVKKAEVEAAALLKETEDDQAAKEMLNTKTAEEVAQCLMKAKESMRAAEEAAEAAGVHRSEAEAALEKAREVATLAAEAVEAKAQAQRAASQASEAMDQATAAATAAAEAAAGAKAAVEEAERTAKMDKNELFPPTPDPTTPKGGEEEEPVPEPLVVPPFVDMPYNLASVLYGEWELVESSYLKGLKRTFYTLREERRTALGHFIEVKKNFLGYLKRPDAKMQLLSTFQQEYNQVDLDLRRLPEAKGELLLRAEELRDALWDVCDAKLAENEAEIERITGDSWVPDHGAQLALHFTALVQLEVDLYLSTAGESRDYYNAKCGYEIFPRSEEEKTKHPARSSEVEEWGRMAEATASDGSRPPSQGHDGGKDAKGAKGGKDAGKDGRAKTPEGKKKGQEEEVETAPWLQPLEESSPGLVKSVMMALKCIPPPPEPEETAEGAAHDAGKGGGKAAEKKEPEKKKGKDEPEETEEEIAERERKEREAKILVMATESILARNSVIFEQRLQRLAQRASIYLSELNEAAQTSKSRLEEWMTLRYQAECSAVAAVIAVIRKACAAETELPHDLKLQGEDFCESIDLLTLVPALPPPPLPPKEPDPALTTLTTAQLQGLASHFQAVAPIGLMAVADAAALLGRVGQEHGGRGLPAVFTHAPPRMLHDLLCQNYDPLSSGFLEWRELLVSLVAQAFPMCPNATLLQIGECLKELRAADVDGDGLLTQDEFLAAKCWFQFSYRPALGFNRFQALKKVLFTALSEPNEATGGDLRMSYMNMILILCTAQDLQRGMEKAFHAMARFPGNKPGAALTWKQVEAVAFPFGRDHAVHVLRTGLETETKSHRYQGSDIQELVEIVAKENGQKVTPDKDVAITVEQLLKHPDGKLFSERHFQRYVLKRLNLY